MKKSIYLVLFASILIICAYTENGDFEIDFPEAPKLEESTAALNSIWLKLNNIKMNTNLSNFIKHLKIMKTNYLKVTLLIAAIAFQSNNLLPRRLR